MSDNTEYDVQEYNRLKSNYNSIKTTINKVSKDANDSATEMLRLVENLSDIRRRLANASDYLNSNNGASECITAIDRLISELSSTANSLRG